MDDPGNAMNYHSTPLALENRPGPVSVLLIEDDLVDEMATLRAVAQEGLPYRMAVARTVVEARKLLAGHRFDVILADYKLTDGTSFDLMDDFADTLVIFITGAWDEAAAANALRLGVHDYLIKDAERKYLKLLGYRVETAMRQRRTERRLRESEARLQAILDNAPASISARDLSGQLILSNRHHDQIASAARDTTANKHMGGAPTETEETLTHVDGSEHTYHTVRFAMPGAEGSGQAMGAISVDITARKLAEEQIRNVAYFDPLTGLPNRRMLLDRLNQALATSARHGGHGAVFFIDLDHFKALNDTLGHDHGDMLLVEVARRLLACVRGEDTVARIGGDEFVVMTVGLAAEERGAASQAGMVGEKILKAVCQPYQLGAHTHGTTPSIGVSLFHGRELAQAEVIKRADIAMYQAKAAGRGTIRFFDPDMQNTLATRQTLEAGLKLALDGGQFQLHFQGQIDALRGAVGAEALLRWHHPQRGVLQPEHFMALAEQNGLIVPIGQWVMAAACKQLGAWAADPRSAHLRLAVNIGTRQFRHAGFVEQVAKSLRDHGADPSRLRLELREGVVQDNPKETLAAMGALHALGVGFALDNFGMGYSSLSSLRRLPFGQVKIAQTLMPRLASDPHDAAVVKTIIGIGRDLGLSVVASGVETLQQRDSLSALGCTLCQGYLFGQPAPLAEFDVLLGSALYATRPAPVSAGP
jgi:diguanylate cyclase (GGDEF)-like protein